MPQTVAITQPTFLPWLGYFELIARSDCFVFLDTVQFEKQSWQSRNRIRTSTGELVWLSVPVRKHGLATDIKEIRVSPEPSVWRRKLSKTVEQCLGKAAHWASVRSVLQIVAEGDHNSLADLNIDIIVRVSAMLGLSTRFLRASQLVAAGKRELLLKAICKEVEADRYYSNAGSAVYLEEHSGAFAADGIEVVFQDWPHPEYRQLGEGFVSHLSVIDALACVGVEGVHDLLTREPEATALG